MERHLSTQEVSWVLGRSPGTVRDRIKDGDIEAMRIVGGYRIPKAEVLRLARERIEAEAGRKLSHVTACCPGEPPKGCGSLWST